MGGPGKARGFVSQETSVFSELWDCSLFYKWDQRGIKVWFAFSQCPSAFMPAQLWASWNRLCAEGPWKWRSCALGSGGWGASSIHDLPSSKVGAASLCPLGPVLLTHPGVCRCDRTQLGTAHSRDKMPGKLLAPTWKGLGNS